MVSILVYNFCTCVQDEHLICYSKLGQAAECHGHLFWNLICFYT